MWAQAKYSICQDNFALSLHNTATRNGRRPDEYLATVCYLRGDKIYANETYLSDVKAMNDFFS
jgi:hypothetical protein